MSILLRVPLRCVFYREQSQWIAHCLEFDLAGHGTTKEKALRLLEDAISAQIEASVRHDNLINLFTPADGRYFEMFAAGRDIATKDLVITMPVTFPAKQPASNEIVIERFDAREYSGNITEAAIA